MRIIFILFAIALILSACSPNLQVESPAASINRSSEPTEKPVDQNTPDGSDNQSPAQSTGVSPESAANENLMQTDSQGAVVVEVTPENLAEPLESLKFNVSLNTHSVDLSMDLAALATLTTDTGKTVQASQWDAPLGGHHISGILIFPETVDGQPILKDAKMLTLTINNLDVPERIFSWDLNR